MNDRKPGIFPLFYFSEKRFAACCVKHKKNHQTEWFRLVAIQLYEVKFFSQNLT